MQEISEQQKLSKNLIELITDLPNLNSSQKLLLCILSLYADEDGSSINVSVAYMAHKLDMDRRNAIRVKNFIIERDYLIVVRQATNRKAAIYRLNINLIKQDAISYVNPNEIEFINGKLIYALRNI